MFSTSSAADFVVCGKELEYFSLMFHQVKVTPLISIQILNIFFKSYTDYSLLEEVLVAIPTQSDRNWQFKIVCYNLVSALSHITVNCSSTL